ncbi:MAG: ADP-ribosylglycohydrolase family protein [Desulfobacteraceae bacterium]|jgi:poly(ADP-ribose) glycohydrolase ARH3
MDLKSKFLGAMLGSAIGDAIGELAFIYPEKARLLSQIELVSELRYTDDTAMAIGVAESIKQEQGIDQHPLGNTFSRNFRREPWRGYASGPPTIFSMVEALGISYVEAARSLFGGGGSLGNGAAMRIAPVGLFFYAASDLYEQACASAEVTHAHAVGMDGAAVQASAVAQAVSLDPEIEFSTDTFIQELIDFARTSEIKAKMTLLEALIKEEGAPSLAAHKIGRTVAVHESMPFAIYAFLQHPKSFEECLFCAILNGGDRDTLGAMSCAISGAYLGVEAIPASWREKLENRAYIENLALALAEKSPR